MQTITLRLMISCLTAVTLLASQAPATDSSPTPGEQTANERTPTEADVRLPEGYRWIFGPVRVSPETMENSSFILDRVGEVLIEPVLEEGTIQEVRLTYQYAEFESVSKEPWLEIRLLDRSGATIRGRNSWSSIGGTVTGIEYFDHIEDLFSHAEWFGVIVLDYEGRLERARAHKNAPEAENYRVPFLPIVGSPFEFNLPTIDDDRMTHEDLLGKIVVYDAWASWCGICIVKMPELRRVRERFAGKGVEFIGIALEMPGEDAMGKAREVIEMHKLDWPHLHGFPSPESSRLWRNVAGIDGIPRLFVVDRMGVVRSEPESHRLAESLQQLLDEQPPTGSSR